jgi:hypothetical protein
MTDARYRLESVGLCAELSHMVDDYPSQMLTLVRDTFRAEIAAGFVSVVPRPLQQTVVELLLADDEPDELDAPTVRGQA